jgi:microsomal dipeptidase-like Zn-dependent dipeptidase
MAHLGFGGARAGNALFWGAPLGPIDQALPCCQRAHGFGLGGASGSIVPTVMEHASAGFCGHPDYDGWPRHTTLLHQQMHATQIRRAFDHGLRLVVGLAVNNELLGLLYHRQPSVDTSDETSIRGQLDGMKELARQNAAWMEVALEPADARRIIRAGKLALVLGIEVDSVLGGRARTAADCDPQRIEAAVERYFQMGARVITPIHLADSALGGCAIFDDRFAPGSHHLFDKYRRDVPRDRWWFEVDRAASTAELGGVQFLSGTDDSAKTLLNLYTHGFPDYASQRRDGHVNAKGLFEAGVLFLEAMMRRGMLVDVDHMSQHALVATLALARRHDYPLVSSHTMFRSLAVPRRGDRYEHGVAHEAMKTDAQLRELAALGSTIAIISHIGPTRRPDGTPGPDTTESWARSYLHAVETLGLERVAVGTDMNGLFGQPGPRAPSNDNAAPGRPGSARGVVYGSDLIPRTRAAIERAQLGRRTFDLNRDGLAHYGLLPDFVVDIALQAGGWDRMTPFFRSADALCRTWDKAMARRPAIPAARPA